MTHVTVPPTPLSRLLPQLADAAMSVNAVLPVVQDGQLVGLINAEELRTFLDLDDAFGLLPRGIPEEPTPSESTALVQAEPIPATTVATDGTERTVGQG